jgi:hypothetical protein
MVHRRPPVDLWACGPVALALALALALNLALVLALALAVAQALALTPASCKTKLVDHTIGGWGGHRKP